jgi:PAS domain-containing protein
VKRTPVASTRSDVCSSLDPLTPQDGGASASPSPSDMAAALASVAGLSVVRSDKEQLARVNQWFEVALNNMARGLSMFDSEQRLIVCNRLYREIYDLSEELTRPGTPLADIVRYHVMRETGRGSPEDIELRRKWIASHVAELARGKTFRIPST